VYYLDVSVPYYQFVDFILTIRLCDIILNYMKFKPSVRLKAV